MVNNVLDVAFARFTCRLGVDVDAEVHLLENKQCYLCITPAWSESDYSIMGVEVTEEQLREQQAFCDSHSGKSFCSLPDLNRYIRRELCEYDCDAVEFGLGYWDTLEVFNH